MTVPRRGYQFVAPVETFMKGPVGHSAQVLPRGNPDDPAPIGKYISEDGIPYEVVDGWTDHEDEEQSSKEELIEVVTASLQAEQAESDRLSLKKKSDAKRKVRRRRR